jgi:thiol-disulfide isomerase/thioredoxin
MASSPDQSTEKAAAGGAKRRRFAVVPAAFVLGALAGLALVYGMVGGLRNAAIPEGCRPAAELAKKIVPLARGEVAALTPAKEPIRADALRFRDAQGRERSIAEWRGRTVLLNLWATWCAPCRQEMLALDALQKKLGGDKFEVVAVNIDTRDPDKPKAWLQENGVRTLAYYADPTARIFQDLKVAGRAIGMPTTILIDPVGCEIGTVAGAAEWASDDAVRLIEAALSGHTASVTP